MFRSGGATVWGMAKRVINSVGAVGGASPVSSDLNPPLEMGAGDGMVFLSGDLFVAVGADNKVHVYQRHNASGDFILRGSVDLATSE